MADHGKSPGKGEYMETKMPHSPAEDEVQALRAASEDEETRVTVPGSPTSTLTDKLLHIIFSILVTDVDVEKKFSGLK